MTLSPELIEQFVAVTAPEKTNRSENTVYATVLSVDPDRGQCIVRFDGASENADDPGSTTPVSYATDVVAGDRVLVMIKNRRATIVGNLSSHDTRNSYPSLYNKPSIEGVTLLGDKTFEELNLSGITNTELEEMLTL